MSSMNKLNGVLLCTDLDGTLLRSDKSISRENLEAIEYFKSCGGYFTYITGRMPYTSMDICEAVKPNAPFGCINGAGVYDHIEGRYLWTKTLPEAAMELVDYAASKIAEVGFQLNTLEKIYFCRDNSAMQRFRRRTNTPYLYAHYNDVKCPIAKVVFGDENEDNILLLEKILSEHPRAEEFDFIRSERTLYEILPKGVNKGVPLEKIATYLNIDRTKTVAVGDYNNDIGMLELAHVGIAVSNASKEAKAAADYITVSNDEDAIARVIYDIESGAISI